MRRAARVDGNHAQITAALTKAGIRVLSLAPMGNGCPDLLCAMRGVNVLLEVKDPAQDPNKRALTAAEQQFHDTWPGPVFLVETAEQAILAVVEAARPKVSTFSADCIADALLKPGAVGKPINPDHA